jgi:hypothetical protein
VHWYLNIQAATEGRVNFELQRVYMCTHAVIHGPRGSPDSILAFIRRINNFTKLEIDNEPVLQRI